MSDAARLGFFLETCHSQDGPGCSAAIASAECHLANISWMLYHRRGTSSRCKFIVSSLLLLARWQPNHLLTDGSGVPLAMHATAANRHEAILASDAGGSRLAGRRHLRDPTVSSAHKALLCTLLFPLAFPAAMLGRPRRAEPSSWSRYLNHCRAR